MPLTYFYAELFGILILVVSLALLANRSMMLAVVREFLDNRACLFLIAIVSLFMGLVLILTHNVWTGGALPIVVTLIGWAMALRAVLLLFLPHATLRRIFNAFKFEQTYYVLSLLALALGVYLVYSGFWG